MVRPAWAAVRAFWHHQGFFLAAGLSFYVIICVVPLVLLLVAGGGILLSDERVVSQVTARLGELLPVYGDEMEAILREIVAARTVSGVLGTAILLLFATQVFAATRLVLNRIFGAPARGFVHGIFFDLGMILLLTLLFFATVAVTAGFAWARSLLQPARAGLAIRGLVEGAGLLLAVGFDTALFAILYRFVPRRRVAWLHVLTGSVAAAVLWELAKQLFRIYILEVGVYRALYGPLAVTVALIMWVYYSAVVFVLGAELICALAGGAGGEGAAV